MARRRRLALALGLAYLYVLGMGFLAGVLVDRVRFDQRRAEVLRYLTLTEARLRARLVSLERRVGDETGRPRLAQPAAVASGIRSTTTVSWTAGE